MGVQIISYRCHLKNRLGRTISSTIVRDVLLDPDAPDAPLKALSEGLRDIKKGETRQISIPAHEAYGLYDPKLVMTRFLDESDIRSPLKLNEQVVVMREGTPTPMRVINFSPETVTLDGNHPLAGQDLVFEIQALETREATIDEIRDAPEGQSFLH